MRQIRHRRIRIITSKIQPNKEKNYYQTENLVFHFTVDP